MRIGEGGKNRDFFLRKIFEQFLLYDKMIEEIINVSISFLDIQFRVGKVR